MPCHSRGECLNQGLMPRLFPGCALVVEAALQEVAGLSQSTSSGTPLLFSLMSAPCRCPIPFRVVLPFIAAPLSSLVLLWRFRYCRVFFDLFSLTYSKLTVQRPCVPLKRRETYVRKELFI